MFFFVSSLRSAYFWRVFVANAYILDFMSKVDFNLYLITDRLNLPTGKTLLGQIEAALRGGVKAVQLREKDLSPAELLPLAVTLRELTHKYGAKLLINSHFDTAITVKADGIHLTSQNPPITEARKKLGANSLVGVSTHSLDEITAATKAGADFVTFGPVFHTPSKAGLGDPVGTEKLTEACDITTIPVFALGGVNPENLERIQNCGCTHFACIGALLNCANPEAAAQSFLAV